MYTLFDLDIMRRLEGISQSLYIFFAHNLNMEGWNTLRNPFLGSHL
jgi:hypothetical protein